MTVRRTGGGVANDRCFIRAEWLHRDQAIDVETAVQAFVDRTAGSDGVVCAAAYEAAPTSEAMADLHSTLHRNARAASAPVGWVSLVSFETLGAAWRFEKRLFATDEAFASRRHRAMLCLYDVLCTVGGPSRRVHEGFAECVQLGSLRAADVESEWQLLDHYERDKLPSFAKVVGGEWASRLLAVAGPLKFGALYQFESVAARAADFERGEIEGRDPSSKARKTLDRVRHANFSPWVGSRIR